MHVIAEYKQQLGKFCSLSQLVVLTITMWLFETDTL